MPALFLGLQLHPDAPTGKHLLGRNDPLRQLSQTPWQTNPGTLRGDAHAPLSARRLPKGFAPALLLAFLCSLPPCQLPRLQPPGLAAAAPREDGSLAGRGEPRRLPPGRRNHCDSGVSAPGAPCLWSGQGDGEGAALTPSCNAERGPPDPSRGFFPPWGPSPGDLLALQEEVKETWRPSPRWMEARGDTQRCWMLATLPQGAGGSGGGRSLKPLLQRLPACLSEHQRGGKGEKRPAGRLEV